MAAAAEGTFISIYENAAGNVIGTYTNEKYSSMEIILPPLRPAFIRMELYVLK